MSELKQRLEALRLDEPQAKRGRGRWFTIAAIAGVVVVSLLAWRGRAADVVEVETITPTLQQPSPAGAGAPILSAAGYVVARRKAVVSAKIQGRLSDLRVEEGSRVRDGETLARLESADYEAAVGRARANVSSAGARIASAEARVARAQADLAESQRQARVAERLTAEGVGAVDDRDAARSRVALAEAALAQSRAEKMQAEADRVQAEADVRFAEAQLQNTLIRAPFTGTVVKKMAEVGESVAPIPPGVNISTSSGAVVALADLDTLEVEVDVSESNVARLGADQPAEVVVEAFPDRKYRGVLRQVIPTADRTKATVMVKVTILDRDADLKPEMSARVTFLERVTQGEAAPRPVMLVAQEAVVTKNGSTSVFEVVDGTRVRSRPIVVGLLQQGRVVVKEGLRGEEILVARPPDGLKDGDAVVVKGRQ